MGGRIAAGGTSGNAPLAAGDRWRYGSGMTKHITIAMAVLAVAACGDRGEDPEQPRTVSVAEAFPNIPLPEGGQIVSSIGEGDARQLIITTPIVADTVVAYYRGLLSEEPYQLVNESTNDGRTSFYVEQDGPPLWVTVEADSSGGTLVRLTGAAIRQAAAQPGPRQ